MASKIAEDPRIDPRIKAIFGAFPGMPPATDVKDRETQLAEANSPEALAAAVAGKAFMDMVDNEQVASSAGLTFSTETFTSAPDGNTIKISYIRPDTAETLPCVYYIHGGGMMSSSAFDGMYRSWGRIIASMGVAVAMVDFRNCLTASSAPEVEPFPAGLNDCVSGLKWVKANAAKLNIDPDRIVVAGESGGGNLTLGLGLQLTKDGEQGLIKGLYALWHRGVQRQEPDRLAGLRRPRRHQGLPAHGDQRQRVRPPARRRHRLLPPADDQRRRRPLPPGDGLDSRHRDLRHLLPGHQPGHGEGPGGVREGVRGERPSPLGEKDAYRRPNSFSMSASFSST